MTKKKKPDAVVFDEEQGKYDAALKPYTTNVGAPAIEIGDTIAWKNNNIHKVNKQVKAQFDEIKAQYEALMTKYEYNNLIYNARFSFEPVVGNVYYLYKDENDDPFLSIIAPEECSFNHLGSFRLTADKMWDKVE
ncbi:DUF2452 domain-containing protein [Aquimarina brevivitae]|uniref:Uncharacterized protein DUF2452 n=1 Tax=Aquimarina brevivitae TaxID=323412 RepID=A0A4Q7PI20_9FLAO|nr:DUF2452 domain-containing protein [Aquimarina brevivitae]RZS99847.1 uncharacterized protein DUF2452 [Aquimarina brevivitae]